MTISVIESVLTVGTGSEISKDLGAKSRRSMKIECKSVNWSTTCSDLEVSESAVVASGRTETVARIRLQFRLPIVVGATFTLREGGTITGSGEVVESPFD